MRKEDNSFYSVPLREGVINKILNHSFYFFLFFFRKWELVGVTATEHCN